MKHTLSTQEMVKLLLKDEFANWSYEGANALVEFLEEMEQGNETETEFDRVAIRCQFTEYENYEELYEAYGSTARNDLRESTLSESDFLDWLNEQTIVIKLPNDGFIVSEF